MLQNYGMLNGILNRKTYVPTPDRFESIIFVAAAANLIDFSPQRRLSEPSGGMPNVNRYKSNNPSQHMNGSNKSRSENEGLDRCNNTWNEIEAGDVRDGK